MCRTCHDAFGAVYAQRAHDAILRQKGEQGHREFHRAVQAVVAGARHEFAGGGLSGGYVLPLSIVFPVMRLLAYLGFIIVSASVMRGIYSLLSRIWKAAVRLARCSRATLPPIMRRAKHMEDATVLEHPKLRRHIATAHELLAGDQKFDAKKARTWWRTHAAVFTMGASAATAFVVTSTCIAMVQLAHTLGSVGVETITHLMNVPTLAALAMTASVAFLPFLLILYVFAFTGGEWVLKKCLAAFAAAVNYLMDG